MVIEKIKENQESKISVARIIKEYVGEDGRTYRKIKWEELEKPINLGSCVNPNKNIVQFKIDIPATRRDDFLNTIGRFFKD